MLTPTNVLSNDQGFTNCCFVHPSNFATLAAAAGQDPDSASKAGILCAVNEAVFWVR